MTSFRLDLSSLERSALACALVEKVDPPPLFRQEAATAEIIAETDADPVVELKASDDRETESEAEAEDGADDVAPAAPTPVQPSTRPEQPTLAEPARVGESRPDEKAWAEFEVCPMPLY